MSTRYSLIYKPCDKCGCGGERMIGKSSAGRFLFLAYPDDGITSYKDWLREFNKKDVTIMNAYGEVISLNDFKELIKEIRKNGYPDYDYRDEKIIIDEEGFLLRIGDYI